MKSWLSLKIEIKNPFYNIVIYIWKCTFVVKLSYQYKKTILQ